MAVQAGTPMTLIGFPDVLIRLPFLPLSICQVSDSTRFGSGGTSAAITVGDSFDTCPSGPALDWFFSIEPVNRLVQCQESRVLWWNPADVRGYAPSLIPHVCPP